jgi:hypothetical protein
VLHHAHLSTTDKYYIKGQKRRAFRQYQKGVCDILEKGRRKQVRRLPKTKKPGSAD